MNNSMNFSVLLHPVVMTIIGLVLGPLVVILGWHTWLSYVLDIYQAVHNAPLSYLIVIGKDICALPRLRSDGILSQI
jgi:hypothetical protein